MHIKKKEKIRNYGPMGKLDLVMFDNRILLVPLIKLDLLQGQTLWAFPELLDIFLNNLSKNSAVFLVSSHKLLSEIPL